MVFKKGNTLWMYNIGKKRDKQILKKMSIATKKRYQGGEKFGFQKGHKINIGGNKSSFKKNHIPWNLNITHSEKTKQKISISKTTLKDNMCIICNNQFHPFYQKQKCCSMNCRNIQISNLLTGRKHSTETKIIIKEKRKLQITPIKDTKIEVKIQNYLKQLGVDFFTHQYIKDIEHGYQCDILIPAMDLIIECDGDYWHKYPVGREIDNVRTKELIEQGFKVLRLWEHEIKVINIRDFKEKLDEVKK